MRTTRRSFLNSVAAGTTALYFSRPRSTQHVIFIVNGGGARKKDYYENADLSPNIDWVKNHPCFSRHTAIVIRPEFGRDDEVNAHGDLHHSQGFYYTHRVASIFWGPGFNRGVDKKTVISCLDMAPTLARIFNVDASYAQGRVVPGLFTSPDVPRPPIAPG